MYIIYKTICLECTSLTNHALDMILLPTLGVHRWGANDLQFYKYRKKFF